MENDTFSMPSERQGMQILQRHAVRHHANVEGILRGPALALLPALLKNKRRFSLKIDIHQKRTPKNTQKPQF